MKTTTNGHTVAEWEKRAAENPNIHELDTMILSKGVVRAVFGTVKYKRALENAAWRADGRCFVRTTSYKPGHVIFDCDDN